MFEQLKANRLPINHVWTLLLDLPKKYRIVFLAAESVPRLRMTDWAWLSDQTAQPWHIHIHTQNQSQTVSFLLSQRKHASSGSSSSASLHHLCYPGNRCDKRITKFWLVKPKLQWPHIHNSQLIMLSARDYNDWGRQTDKRRYQVSYILSDKLRDTANKGFNSPKSTCPWEKKL